MTRPRLLDLFCGAGGAGMGYHRAGFEVVGVDIHPQPRYPFEFIQADALTFPNKCILAGFDVVHASPPCQRYSSFRHIGTYDADVHPDLVGPVRDRLVQHGRPWVIENVQGSPLNSPFVLCGSMFGLGVRRLGMQLRRHRHFESSSGFLTPPCQHNGPTIGIYGDHPMNRRRVRGHKDRGSQYRNSERVQIAQEALGIDWVDVWDELKEAIPPAYTEWIGRQLMKHLA